VNRDAQGHETHAGEQSHEHSLGFSTPSDLHHGIGRRSDPPAPSRGAAGAACAMEVERPVMTATAPIIALRILNARRSMWAGSSASSSPIAESG
jgi:hypothetical protein